MCLSYNHIRYWNFMFVFTQGGSVGEIITHFHYSHIREVAKFCLLLYLIMTYQLHDLY
jgi:hypothetical protein